MPDCQLNFMWQADNVTGKCSSQKGIVAYAIYQLMTWLFTTVQLMS